MKAQLKEDFVKSITKTVIKKSIIYFKEPLTFVIRINSVHITFPETNQMDNLQIWKAYTLNYYTHNYFRFYWNLLQTDA